MGRLAVVLVKRLYLSGEFFCVSWASVAESGGGFLSYSTGVGDRSQVNGKGKSRVFRERVRRGCLVWSES